MAKAASSFGKSVEDSASLPPRYVEYTSAPHAAAVPGLVCCENFATNASKPRLFVLCTASRVGKSGETVHPPTYALPTLSTAIAHPLSSLRPPRYEEKRSDDPEGDSLDTNASRRPPYDGCTGLTSGKVTEH